jgi:hypothetical protein
MLGCVTDQVMAQFCVSIVLLQSLDSLTSLVETTAEAGLRS